MTHETDLPCSDCEASLVERTIRAHELPVSTRQQGSIVIAECPDCGARYYPEETLTELASPSDSP